MANNRLAIYDTLNGEAFMLAKGFGSGWSFRPDGHCMVELLEMWLERSDTGEAPRDLGASGGGHDTDLKLITESSPEWAGAVWVMELK
jgi:hypothetical protein